MVVVAHVVQPKDALLVEVAEVKGYQDRLRGSKACYGKEMFYGVFVLEEGDARRGS